MKSPRFLAAGALAALLAACQTTAPPKLAWSRKDGQVMTGNEALLATGQSDSIQCRARAAQAAGQVDMPTSVAIGQYASGGYGAARQTSVQNDIFDTTMEACMDERGYRLITVTDADPYTPTRAR